MTSLHWIAAASALGLGLSIALLIWWLLRAIDSVPPDDRSYNDAPPLMFRLMWWPLRWVSHYLGPALSPAYRQAVLGRLRVAGLDYALAPEQFVAARLLLALIAGLLLALGR